MPIAKIDNINIYYEIHGKGDPLVLIMGFSQDISEWEKTIVKLSEKYRVLAFDNRGAGRSDKPDIPYTIEIMADDTAKLMEAIGIMRADILGISMGGRIALALALQHPGKVKGLVLASTGCRTVKTARFRFLNALSKMPVFKSKYPQPGYAKARQLEASRGFNCTGNLEKIKAPTLILHGKKDKIAPYTIAEEMHAGIKGSKIVGFDGGHLFPVWKEEGFIREVNKFMEKQH